MEFSAGIFVALVVIMFACGLASGAPLFYVLAIIFFILGVVCVNYDGE
jgi:hypothetical protein